MASERDQGKIKIQDQVLAVLEEDPKYCGDDNHALNIELCRRKFGFEITAEQIRFIVSVDRSRRKVLDENTHLEQRTDKLEALAKADAHYYASSKGNSNVESGTKGFIPYKKDKIITKDSLFDDL